MKSLHVRRPALRRRGAARVIPEVLGAAPSASADAALVARPDGWYWIAPDGQQAFGPFADRLSAIADRDALSSSNEEGVSESERLVEVERELGIGTWIDAETGEPAEGQSPPHLNEP